MYVVAVELPIKQTNVSGVDAPPGGGGENSNLLTSLLGLICGTLCKDTPLAEIVPQPTDASQTMALNGRWL